MGKLRRHLGQFLALIITVSLSAIVMPSPAAKAADIQEVIGSFETDANAWALGLGTEFPGATGVYRPDSDAKVGSNSGLVTGDFTNGGQYVQISRAVDLDAKALRFWVRSDDLTAVRLRVVDATGQTHQQRLALTSGGAWQELIVTNFAGGASYGHFGGANDGVWHGPAIRVALMIDKGDRIAGRTAATVRFDQIAMSVPAPDLTIRQAAPGNIFVQPATPSVRVVSRGDAVSWTVTDFWGEQVASGRTTMDSAEKAIALPAGKLGYFTLSLTAELSGQPIATRTTTFALLSPFDVPQTADSPFGMAVHLTRTSAGDPNFDRVPLMANAGVKNVRVDASWSSIEPVKGQYTFSRFDGMVSKLDANGMRWLPIGVYTNPNYDNNATPYTDAGRDGFANYIAATANHYQDNVKWVEIYNEFNIGFGDRGDGPADSRADYYYPLLKASYEKLKAQNPNTVVVGAATSGVPMAWLEQLFALGGLQYMDVLSIHPYVYPGSPERVAETLANLNELVKRYNGGKTKPIWITEQGWPTQLDARGVTEATQASYIVRSHVIGLSQGVERFFWYDFMNDGLNPTHNEDNFGIIRNTTDAAGKWTPKPAYVSYAAMTRQLTGATYQRQEQVASGTYSFLFRKSGIDTRVLWSTTPTTVAVETENPITVTDLTGVSKTYQPQSGRVYLSLSGDPLYVTGNNVKVTVDSRITLKADNGGNAVMGDPVGLTLSVDNTKAPRVPIKARFDIAGTPVDISVRSGEKVDIPITVPASGGTGRRDLVGNLVVANRPTARLGARVQVTHPLTLKAKHVLKGDADVLSVTVTSTAGRDIAVSDLPWKIGTQSGTADLPSSIPAGSTHTVDIPLAGIPTGTQSSELRLSATGFPDVALSGKVVLLERTAIRPLAMKPISVDGVLDDMSGVDDVDLAAEGTVKITNYGGVDDLSGSIWTTWDANNLYLSARIRDNVQSQGSTGDQIWSGDSIQFGISPGTPGESAAWYECGIALTPSGPQMYRWLTAEGTPGPVTNANLKVTRNEAAKETVYELAIPWQQLGPIRPDDRLLSLSFAVNDDDGTGRRGWIEWGAGIAGAKNSALFKPAVLS